MDPLEEAPWADAATTTTSQSSDPLAASADSSKRTAGGTGAASSSLSSSSTQQQQGGRSSRLTPRRLVAQPTRLQAVEDDPLGPLGAPAAGAGPLASPGVGAENLSPLGAGAPSGASSDTGPPAPPKEHHQSLAMRPAQQQQQGGQQQQQQQRKVGTAADPHGILDEDEDEDARLFSDATNRPGSGLRAPPPVAPAAAQGQVGGGGRPGGTPQSVSIEQAAKPSFWITVGDPHKVGDLTSSHIVYSVRTKTTSKGYKQPEFEVKRRYRDFLWLYNTLHANNPGVVVPAPPEKQAVGRFESNFVENRRQALERMLNKTAHHPALQHDADLKLFLESEAFNVDVKHKERREPNLGESKGVLSSLGIGGSSNKFVEQDDWFHDRRIYLDALENQLKALLKAMETMVGQRKAMAEAANDFSASLHALSTVELSPGLSGPLDALSELQQTIRDIHDRQAQQDVLTFGIVIEEYIRLIGSAKQAFAQRQKAFYSWHSAESELAKRRAAHDKLLRQGRSQQDRLNQVGAEVADAERKVHQARLLFEDMGRLMRTELDRFEREKVEDFKSGVETFLESAVEAQKELIEKWETFLMQLDADDDEAAFYKPPVFQASSGGNNAGGGTKPAGDTAVDRARARIDEDSD